MSTTLRKTEGTVTLEIVLTTNPDGSIDQQRIRIASTRTSKKTKYPLASFAPMSTEDKVQELVNDAIAAGYAVAENTSDTFESYSFLIELPASSEDRLRDVVAALGSEIHVDSVNNVTSITGTEFWIGTFSPSIRITAAINVQETKQSKATFLHHVVMARCLEPEAKLYDSDGTDVDTKAYLQKASRDGALTGDQLEVLYTYGVLRRPVTIDQGIHTGIYATSF